MSLALRRRAGFAREAQYVRVERFEMRERLEGRDTVDADGWATLRGTGLRQLEERTSDDAFAIPRSQLKQVHQHVLRKFVWLRS